MTDTNLTANMEDYLEAVFYLKNANGVVRVRDIAERLGVKMPSASDALKNLSRELLVSHESYGHVELTAKGEVLAEKLLERHHQMAHFLRDVLGVKAETAEQDACRIEHVLSPQSMERLLMLIQAIETCGDDKCFLRTGKIKTAAPPPQQQRPVEEKFTLDALEKGQTAFVSDVEQHKTLRRKLIDMGFTAGAEVSMAGDPARDRLLSVTVKGYRVTLEKKEARMVRVTPAE